MGRNNTKAVKNIAKMYEQLGLAQDDIFHKTKLLLSIYRDVVWATLADCNCVNEEIYYYGDDLTDALVYRCIARSPFCTCCWSAIYCYEVLQISCLAEKEFSKRSTRRISICSTAGLF